MNDTASSSNNIFQIYFNQSLYDTFKYANVTIKVILVGATNAIIPYNVWNITDTTGYESVAVTTLTK